MGSAPSFVLKLDDPSSHLPHPEKPHDEEHLTSLNDLNSVENFYMMSLHGIHGTDVDSVARFLSNSATQSAFKLFIEKEVARNQQLRAFHEVKPFCSLNSEMLKFNDALLSGMRW